MNAGTRIAGHGGWRSVGWILGLLALLVVLLVAAQRGEMEAFLASLRSLAPGWLALAVLLQSGTYLSVAAAWRFGLSLADPGRASLRRLLPLSVAKLFIDQTLPSGGMSGTAFLVQALARRGVPRTTCMDVLVANLVGHFTACVLAALAAIGMLGVEQRLQPWMIATTLLFVLVSLAIPAGVVALRRYGRSEPPWLRQLPLVAPLLEFLGDSPLELARRPRVIATMTAWNAAVIVLDATTLWLMLHALGAGTPFAVAFPAFLLAMMVATLGPVPVGLGTFEATCVSSLVMQGVALEVALAGTLLLRGFTTWLPMLPGILLVRRELRSSRPPPPV